MSDEPAARESAGCVFGITLGLALFAVAILTIARSESRPLASPVELWEEHFQGGAAPSGYEFTGAAVLPEDRKLVKLRRIGAEGPGPASESEPEAEGEQEESEIDWQTLTESERGTPPDELVFVFYPRASSEAMLVTYFQNLGDGNEEDLGDKGGTVVVESGELDWKGFRTGYVRQREYQVQEGEPRFVDSLRVNLSIGQSCVFIAIWPPSFPGSVDVIETLLKEVEPLQAADR